MSSDNSEDEVTPPSPFHLAAYLDSTNSFILRTDQSFAFVGFGNPASSRWKAAVFM